MLKLHVWSFIFSHHLSVDAILFEILFIMFYATYHYYNYYKE